MLIFQVFKRGLQLYISRHKYGNTCTGDLWKALSDVSREDIEALMSTWTTQMGFPVLTVRRVSGPHPYGLDISIKQERFLADGGRVGKTLESSSSC